MNIENRQQEELLLYHQQFLQNPISQQIRKLLEKRCEFLTNFIADKSSSSDVTDQQIRLYATQLKEVKNIISVIYNSELFLEKSTKL